MREDDSGLTLPELLVTMIAFGMVAALSVQVTLMLAGDVRATVGTANAIAQVRLALSSMERQVRSGGVLFSPSDEAATNPRCHAYGTAAGSCLRVYTQAGGTEPCAQWQIIPDPDAPGLALLRTRSFSPSWQTDGTVQPWHTVARGLQAPSASAPPFVLQGAATPFDARLIDVTLTAADTTQNGRIVSLTSSLAGRDITYGDDSALCVPVPT